MKSLRVTDAHNELAESTAAWQANAEKRFDGHEERLVAIEHELPLKATLVETSELREALKLCALRTEMRELLEALRQETTSRVRMLKERLDRTDRELLRQLEEAQNNDRSDKFDALAAVVETKADKALTERWLEASQQLHGELQTVHVRTQTLGQGMKVVLGWVEGMADKVTGLQGAQHRMQAQVASAREEQQFALNATARETITKVKGMLVQQQAAMPPAPMPSGFGPSKPLATASGRPTTGDTRSGPVVLKSSAMHEDGLSASASAAVGAAAAFADEAAMLDPAGRQMLLEGGALAGPAGAALAGVVPATGVMGKQAMAAFSDDSEPGSRPGTAPQAFKTEAERRRHQLDVKRRDLVESRMKSGAGGAGPSTAFAEPRPPDAPRPDPRLGFSHPLSPRRLEGLELEGQPPPAVHEGDLHPSGAVTAR